MKRCFRNVFLVILSSVALMGSWGCTTKKNTAVTRTFHNVTSRYNYHFNAKLNYAEAIKNAESSYDYNYTFPLPVTLIGQQKAIGMVGGNMDRSITKCTNLINLHSIRVKPEKKGGLSTPKERKFYNQTEFVRWVREAWLLIGQARTWSGKYDEARATFDYILLQFPETPMWYESNVWLAFVDMQTGDYISAEERLRNMSNHRKYPKKKYYTHLLQSAWATYYQQTNQPEETIKHLKLAYDVAPDRAHKQRYTYLLGQLYQEQKNITLSNSYFKKTLKLNPTYEMGFNARVNIASNYQGGKGSQDLIKTLKKMAKDEKNSDFLDQIYYALGNIEQSKGNMEGAIEYYQLSAQKSVNNNNQKGLSYLVLADYFFERPNYTVSQAYYDSAYTALDEDYPGYKELEVKTLNLNQLVENLNVVSHQDSIQRVAIMNPRERDVLIAELIKRVTDEEDRLRREEQENRDRFAHFQRSTQGRLQQDHGGSWYFYNQASLSQGLAEFTMRWGRRKLEDNWRRSNKREVLDPSTELAETQTDSTGNPLKVIDNKSREYYLQDLPTTDSLLNISHGKIQEALYKVAGIYENELRDYPEATKAYLELGKRYPKSDYALQAYYNLYQIALFNQNVGDQEKYKQIIISQFPNSTYALLIGNPDYIEKLEKEMTDREAFYQRTFELYRQGKYHEAKSLAEQGINRYAGTSYEPKLRFIQAQCVAGLGDISQYKIALTEITSLYQGTEIAASALEMLKLVDKHELQLAAQQESSHPLDEISSTDSSEVVVAEKPMGEHLFVAIVPKGSPLNQLRFNFVSFNVDYFIDHNLTVALKEFSEYVSLITVEKFKGPDEAMEYYRAIAGEKEVMGNVSPDDYSIMVMGREQYNQFLKEKTIASYLNFFRQNYLK